MKKALSLISALIICLTLCACGSNDTPQTTTAESTTAEDSTTENNTLLSEATEADFRSIYEKCRDNIVAAKDRYVGTAYKFAGIVKDIGEESITVAPMKFPTYPYGSWYRVEVFMSKDDIVKVSAQEIVNVAGEISNLTSNSAEMQNGILIDANIAFEGEVTGFYIYESSKHIMQIRVPNGIDKKIIYNYEVGKADRFENITEASINGTTFVVGDYVSGIATMEAYGAYSDSFNIVEIISIEKSQ